MLANLVSLDCWPESSLRLPGSMAHAEWCHVRLSACQVSEYQLSHVLQGARVITCGHWKPLATSRAGPAQSRCSLGVGVLCQILCKPNLMYLNRAHDSSQCRECCPIPNSTPKDPKIQLSTIGI